MKPFRIVRSDKDGKKKGELKKRELRKRLKEKKLRDKDNKKSKRSRHVENKNKKSKSSRDVIKSSSSKDGDKENKGVKGKNNKQKMSEKKKELMSLKKSLEQKKLLLSCERGDISTLRSIINKYRDKRKNTKMLRSLLEYEDINNNDRTPLVYCCINGNVECLLELLRNNVNLEHFVSGSTALYHATSRGNIECVEELLIYGSNANALNHKGWTCLMNAAYFGHNKIVQLLLEYGANPDIQRKNYDNKCALHFAAKNGRYKVVQLLLEFGANTNLFDNNDNMTSLMYSVKNNYYQIVQLLILYGANPYLKNKDGKCAIDFIQNTNNDTSLKGNGKDDDEKNGNDVNEIFTFMQQSTHIYNAITKLVVPDTMRKIMVSLRKIDHIYPPIIAQLRSVSHMHQLGQSELDMHHFNNVICAQLTADLSKINPMHQMDDLENETEDERHEMVLDQFRKDIILCKSNTDRCEQNVNNATKQLKQIESDILQTTKGENELKAQISLLQRQLKLCQNRQKQLKQKQISQKSMIVNYKTSLSDSRNELEMKNKIFLLMDEASRNIRNICTKGNNIPLGHRRELQTEYKKKRKMLEESWNLWNLDDVITWICSLDPSGRFYKYKENLRKLKHLEDASTKTENDRHNNRLRKKFKHQKGVNNEMNYDNFLMEHYNYDKLLDMGDEYDGDEGKSDAELDEDNVRINHLQIQRNNSEMVSAEDIEGKDDFQNDVEDIDDIMMSDAEFGDDDEVAIADPNGSSTQLLKKKKKKEQLMIDMRAVINDSMHHKFIASEGQYNVQYSDSDCSNNDKHGASEVIMSALMPGKDTSSEDDVNADDQKISEFDVDKLLDNMENIFENLSNRETDENDVGLESDEQKPKFSLQRSKTVAITTSGVHRPRFRGSVSSSSMDGALSDGSYSGPEEPILESINNTVLKMCGIRDGQDRKIIMYHIEALINGNSPNPNSSNGNSPNVTMDSSQSANNKTPDISTQQYEQIQVLNIPEMDKQNDEKSDDKKEDDNMYDDELEETDYEDDEDEIGVPSEFQCPITKQIMEDPVICSDGHSYERFAIEDWLVKHEKSPMTNKKLVTKQVFPNHSLRSMIALYRMNQK